MIPPRMFLFPHHGYSQFVCIYTHVYIYILIFKINTCIYKYIIHVSVYIYIYINVKFLSNFFSTTHFLLNKHQPSPLQQIRFPNGTSAFSQARHRRTGWQTRHVPVIATQGGQGGSAGNGEVMGRSKVGHGSSYKWNYGKPI